MSDTLCAPFLPYIPTEEVIVNDFLNYIEQDDLMKEISFSNVEVTTKAKKPDKNSKSKSRLYCPHCPASFFNTSNLQSHIRTHTGERPYKCHMCNFSCSQSSNLKGHLRTHTGEKPFRCTVCNKSFARSSHLTGHERLHTGDMPYECNICTKKFYTSTRLKKHQKDKHDDGSVFFCGVCEESFVNDCALQVHLFIHTGKRPFKCAICSAAFRSKEDLKIHVKLHVGMPSKYECSSCSKIFQIKMCCEKHVKHCKSHLQNNTTGYILFDNALEGNIEVASELLDTDASSNEIVIQVDEESSPTTCEDSESEIETDPLSFPDFPQYIVQDGQNVFDIQFKSEDEELTVAFLDVADESVLFQDL